MVVGPPGRAVTTTHAVLLVSAPLAGGSSMLQDASSSGAAIRQPPWRRSAWRRTRRCPLSTASFQPRPTSSARCSRRHMSATTSHWRSTTVPMLRAQRRRPTHAGSSLGTPTWRGLCSSAPLRCSTCSAALQRLNRAQRSSSPTTGGSGLTDNREVIAALRHLGALPPSLTDAVALDIAYGLMSPELHWVLTDDRGWSHDRYEEWLAAALCSMLLAR